MPEGPVNEGRLRHLMTRTIDSNMAYSENLSLTLSWADLSLVRAFEIPNSKHQIPNNIKLPNIKCSKKVTAHLPHSLLSLGILNIGICLGFRYCDLGFNVMNFKHVWLAF